MSHDMGNTEQSKHLTPSHFGETLESCPVTLLLLRAWSVLRVVKDPTATQRRKLEFHATWLQLLSEAQQLNDGSSLGAERADEMWESFKEQISKHMSG